MLYLLSQNASKPLKLKDEEIQFEPVMYLSASASWWGVFATDNVKLVDELRPLVSKSVIQELSKADYDDMVAKKKQTSGYENSLTLSSKSPAASQVYSGRPAQVVEDPAPPSAPSPVEAPEQVLAVTKVIKK